MYIIRSQEKVVDGCNKTVDGEMMKETKTEWDGREQEHNTRRPDNLLDGCCKRLGDVIEKETTPQKRGQQQEKVTGFQDKLGFFYRL